MLKRLPQDTPCWPWQWLRAQVFFLFLSWEPAGNKNEGTLQAGFAIEGTISVAGKLFQKHFRVVSGSVIFQKEYDPTDLLGKTIVNFVSLIRRSIWVFEKDTSFENGWFSWPTCVCKLKSGRLSYSVNLAQIIPTQRLHLELFDPFTIFGPATAGTLGCPWPVPWWE